MIGRENKTKQPQGRRTQMKKEEELFKRIAGRKSQGRKRNFKPAVLR
jgi:hypothetical protein